MIDHIKLAVCSWNLGGVKPYDQIELRDWLLPGLTGQSADLPDIFVIGIQHIMPNKSSRMFNKNNERLAFMQTNIMSVLNTHASQASYT